MCDNGYVKAKFGTISVEQMPEVVETNNYLVVFICVGVFVVLLFALSCYLRNKDVKDDRNWKSKYMQERIKQIEE